MKPEPRVVRKGEVVVSRGGDATGVTTGTQFPCGLEGCTGVRVGVKWGDGRHTFPCSKGMDKTRRGWEIV
jgi:hypothetical protein